MAIDPKTKPDLHRIFDVSKITEEIAADLAEPARTPFLVTREQTHGSFENNAIVSQAFKRMFRASPGWEALCDVERESMDMIALKFSRILSGRSLEKQHWEDVVGYAKLVEEKCVS